MRIMDDLISRDDVYDVLKKVNIREMPIYVFDKLWNGIRDLPSIEPERTAKVVKEDNICICDNCSGLILIPFDKTEENLRKYAITGYKGHNIYFASYKYCPNCGAKLDWSGDE